MILPLPPPPKKKCIEFGKKRKKESLVPKSHLTLGWHYYIAGRGRKALGRAAIFYFPPFLLLRNAGWNTKFWVEEEEEEEGKKGLYYY